MSNIVIKARKFANKQELGPLKLYDIYRGHFMP